VDKFARASRGNLKGTALKPTLIVLGVLASALILALAGFGLGWIVSGQQIANLKERPGPPPAMTTSIAKPDATLPNADVPGEDSSDLPRYPGSVRVKYERRVSTAGLILIDTEYVASARLADVQEFYRGVFRSEGWMVAGLDVTEGEWDFLVTKGVREALIEIEIRRGLVEIEIEVSEPKQATPSTPPSSDGDEGDDFDEGAKND
jgi:hypothetical protein